MKYLLKREFISLFLVSASIICNAHICSAQANASFFQNFEIANHKIYVLHADGILKIFDENGKSSDTYLTKNKIKELTKDHNGNIVVIDSTNCVQRLNSNQQWSTIIRFHQGAIFKVAFNNVNDCFLVTDKGVVDARTQNLYFPDKKLFQSEWSHHGNNAFESADNVISVKMDEDNNLWFSFWHGEWGSDVFILNTKDFTFIAPGYWNVMPAYESHGHLFAITGNLFGQYLVQIDKLYDQDKKLISFHGTKVYSTEDDSTYQKAEHLHNKPHPGIKSLDELEWYNFYVGGFTFRASDGRFYLITSEGLLTADHLNRDTKFGDLYTVKNFAFPKEVIHAYVYYEHEKHEIKFKNGYPQFVSKIQFNSKGDLVMLAPANGVWLFNGKQVKIVE